MPENLFFYEGGLILTCSCFILLSIFAIGWCLRWKKKAHYWRQMYYESIKPVEPPEIVADPFEGVRTALEYNWEETWD